MNVCAWCMALIDIRLSPLGQFCDVYIRRSYLKIDCSLKNLVFCYIYWWMTVSISYTSNIAWVWGGGVPPPMLCAAKKLTV